MSAVDSPMHRAKRRRLRSPAVGGQREDVSNSGIWLDKLPVEVCERVVAHVCRSQQNLDALALAKTSPVQRRSVLVVLGNRLIIHDLTCDATSPEFLEEAYSRKWDTQTWGEWISMMGEDIVELDQRVLLSLGRRQPPRFVLPVLLLPNLRMAQITDHPSQIAAVVRSPSLREILVTLRGHIPPTEVFDTLSKLPLVTLRTRCLSPSLGRNSRCPFRDPEVTGLDLGAIARRLSHLTTLDVCCACNRTSKTEFWKLLVSLKSVEEVRFCWRFSPVLIPEEVLRFLSTRRSVRLFDSCELPQLASLIGSSVSEIYEQQMMAFGAFSAEQVRGLRNHPRLRRLCFKIEEGADVALPDVVQQLPELRALDLMWARPGLQERGMDIYSGSRVVVASPGMMLRTVQVSSKLSHLCVGRVRIALTELVSILEWIGLRLRVFETSVRDQEESPFERLEVLLVTAAKNNTELRRFSIMDVKHERGPMPLEEWKRQAQRVLARMRFLEKRAAFLWIGELEVDIRDMVIVE